MPFSDVKGQDRPVAQLKSALVRGALHHAYLFGGPTGVGKGAAARALAQAANCANLREGEACGKCAPCRKIAKGTHPDVLVVEAERTMAKAGRWEPKGGRTPSKDIVVDQVRELIDRGLSMRRYEGKRRFVILDPADALNVQAQNALLKTLEEPPPDTTLVLVAARPESLLATIRSRCAHIAFSPQPQALDSESLASRAEAIRAAAALRSDNALPWIELARAHGETREEARAFCELMYLWSRDLLAVKSGASPATLAASEVAEVTRAAAATLTAAQIARRAELASEASLAIKQNAGATLAIERMIIGFFHG